MWTEPEGKKLRFRLDGTVATAFMKVQLSHSLRLLAKTLDLAKLDLTQCNECILQRAVDNR